jgi:dipeptidyl aminopeptidase/acylaminoacyl peptidase
MRLTLDSTFVRALLYRVLPLQCALLAGGQGVDPRPLDIAEVVRAADFHVLGHAAAISPDGAWIAYTICHSTSATAGTTSAEVRHVRACEIWLTDSAGKKTKRISRGDFNSWAPSWSPNGEFLAFYSDSGGVSRVRVWSAQSTSTRQLSDQPARPFWGFEVPVWSPDSRSIAVKLRPTTTVASTERGSNKSSRPARDSSADDGATVVIYRSGSADSGGRASAPPISKVIDDSYALSGDLAIIDVATGRSRILTRGVRANWYRFSPDGARIAYLDSHGVLEGKEGFSSTFSLVVVDVALGKTQTIDSQVVQRMGTAVSWSPDGKWLAYVSGNDLSHGGLAPFTVRGNLYLASVVRPSIRSITGAPDNTFTTELVPPAWEANGSHFYILGRGRVWRGETATASVSALTATTTPGPEEIVATSDGLLWSLDDSRSFVILTHDAHSKRDGFAKVDVATGAITPLLQEERSYGTGAWAPIGSRAGVIVYRADGAAESPDLWIADPRSAHTRRLTTINPALETNRFGKSRLIDFRSNDGIPLQASLLLPSGYTAGTRYPLVVRVYAGGMGSENVQRFGLSGAFNMQMFATRGYASLDPDIPVHTGTPMQDLMKTVMPAIDRVIALGIADPDRIVLMGHSNGGYSTIALLVQTNRFKAAVMSGGFGDLTAFYGYMRSSGEGSWIQFLEQQDGGGAMGAPPWEVPQRYVENSPIYYLNRVRTPLIIQAGTADLPIIGFSDAVFVGLKRLGREVTYLRYEGEGHMLERRANLIDFWGRVLAFFGKRVGYSEAGKGRAVGGR